MPELPEVETIKRDLAARLPGQVIKQIKVMDGRVIRGQTQRSFIKDLLGCKFQDVSRRGKAVICHIDGPKPFLVVQPMMTGQLIINDESTVSGPTKVTFILSNDMYLHYNDQRLFGRLRVVKDLSELPYFRDIGPEPLGRDFSAKHVAKLLPRRSIPIKPLLLDHKFVSGVGNIYASEILFRSKISPLRAGQSLTLEEIKRLCGSTRSILKDAVKWRGTSMRNYRDGQGEQGQYMKRIKVYGREAQDCPQCKAPIVRIFQSGRSTFYCQNCQN